MASLLRDAAVRSIDDDLGVLGAPPQQIDAEQLRSRTQAAAAGLSAGLGKVAGRFVLDMVYGMLASGSVRLTRIAEALAEPIGLHATHKRLSRNLGKRRTGEVVAANLLKAASERIRRDALLVVDLFDLPKPHARKMQYLGNPAANGHLAPNPCRGYKVCEVFGWDSLDDSDDSSPELPTWTSSSEAPPQSRGLAIAPLAQAIWSEAAPGFRGDGAEVLEVARRVAGACRDRGVFAVDVGRDCRLLDAFVGAAPARFVARLAGDCEVLRRNRSLVAAEVASACETPYGITVYKRRSSFDQGLFIHFGCAPVRLPAHPSKPLWLIVIKGLTGADDDLDPLLMLTNEPMRRNRSVLWRPVWSFLQYWDAVRTNRGVKRQFDFGDVRVLGYDRLRNIGALLQAAVFVSASWPGSRWRKSLFLRPRTDTQVRLRRDPESPPAELAPARAGWSLLRKRAP